MKLNKYDFYSTVIGILLFICVAAFIALVMACGTTKPATAWDYDASCPYVFKHDCIDVPPFKLN